MMENNYEGMQATESIEKKHSGYGVTSFIMSITIGILLFILFAVAGVVAASTPGGMDKQSMQAMVIGFGIIILLFCTVISTALGIVGLFQKERKKVFAILGTMFSLLILLGGVGLIVMGVIVSQSAM